MARALVTGGSGFVGSHLVEHLLSQGDEVRVLIRDSSRPGWLKLESVEVFAGDVADSNALDRAVRGTDVVYHAAGSTLAFSEDYFNRVNEAGTANVAAACARRSSPPVLVLVSSLAAAGPSWPGRPRVEADPAAPITPYGRSKLRGEEALRRYRGRAQLRSFGRRLFSDQENATSYGCFGWSPEGGTRRLVTARCRFRWWKYATWRWGFVRLHFAAGGWQTPRTTRPPGSTFWLSPNIPRWMSLRLLSPARSTGRCRERFGYPWLSRGALPPWPRPQQEFGGSLVSYPSPSCAKPEPVAGAARRSEPAASSECTRATTWPKHSARRRDGTGKTVGSAPRGRVEAGEQCAIRSQGELATEKAFHESVRDARVPPGLPVHQSTQFRHPARPA